MLPLLEDEDDLFGCLLFDPAVKERCCVLLVNFFSCEDDMSVGGVWRCVGPLGANRGLAMIMLPLPTVVIGTTGRTVGCLCICDGPILCGFILGGL